MTAALGIWLTLPITLVLVGFHLLAPRIRRLRFPGEAATVSFAGGVAAWASSSSPWSACWPSTGWNASPARGRTATRRRRRACTASTSAPTPPTAC